MRKFRIEFFLFFFFIPLFANAQSYLQNLRGKTSGQIANAAHGTRLDSTFFISRVGTNFRDVTRALLERGYSADDFSSLAAAINQAESDTAMVIVSENHKSLSATDTLRRTASLVVYKGGLINIATGVTFHIQGSFFAGNYQVFEGSGTVIFGNGAVDRVNAAWFGAQSMSAAGGDSIDNVTAIRKAITVYEASINGAHRQEMDIYLPPGIYHISDSLLFQKHDAVINFDGKLRPYGSSYSRYLVVIDGDEDSRTTKYPLQHNRARLSVKRLRLDGRHQCKGFRIEDMMHAQINEVHCERIKGAAFKASRFKESIITNLNIHTSKASTDSALLILDGETGTQDANNNLRFIAPNIEYSGGRYVYISTSSTTLPRGIDFIGAQLHHLDVTAVESSVGIRIDSTGSVGDVVVDIVKGRDIKFFGGNIRVPASPYSRCVRIGQGANAPQRTHFYGTVISNATTTGGMGIEVRAAGRTHVEDVTDDVTADSLYVSPQIYRQSENNPLVVTFNSKVTADQPGLVIARTNAQGATTTVNTIKDTSSIVIDVEKSSEPVLEFYSAGGGDSRFTVTGAPNNAVMRMQRAIRWQFDSTTVVIENFGVGTSGPKHEMSLYDATPRFGMTDTNVNTTTSTVAQAQDTAAIAFDASTAIPSLQTKDTLGRTRFIVNSSGSVGLGYAVSPADSIRFEVDNDVDATRDSSFTVRTNGGMVVGNPTGGNKGPGTINAKAVYDDNVLLTDFVFETNYIPVQIDSMQAFYERNKHLPTIDGRAKWEAEGKFALGKLVNQLWETVEVQAKYIAELNARLKKIEESK